MRVNNMFQYFEQIMNEKKLKMSDVARGAGIPYSTLTDWKVGRYTPKLDKLQKIADFLGVSLEYLQTGKDSEKESDSGKKYYFSDKTAEVAQELFENSEMRLLFDAAKDSKPEDLKMAADLLKRLKETNPYG